MYVGGVRWLFQPPTFQTEVPIGDARKILEFTPNSEDTDQTA